jgi:hypothetical protein
MKRLKKVGIIFTIVVMAFLLTGCGTKNVKTANDFVALAEDSNLSTKNIKEGQYASDNTIKEGYVAYNNNWQIEFYVLDTEATASSNFDTNVKIFEDSKGNSSSYVSLEGKNYEAYSLISNGQYMYICRVENTFIYANVSEEYQKDVKAFIKNFGY